ncbi:12342_t:CDS:10 [Ambispora leptoticha]|uniref:12342_t:CDS:1 n=1 Tax=Ambispora leptoticha TaxID=144679 RepID=A0A9N9A5K6_9GLOM|nr:12342_t:CDS:10 [Ambispora leptoticha]
MSEHIFYNVSPAKRKHEYVNETTNILTENNSPKRQCSVYISVEGELNNTLSIKKPSRVDSHLLHSLFEFSDNLSDFDESPKAESLNSHAISMQEARDNEKPVNQVPDAQLANSKPILLNSSDRILRESNRSKANEKQENISGTQLADKGSLLCGTPAKSSKFDGFSTANGKPAKKISDAQRAYAESIFSSNSNRIMQELNSCTPLADTELVVCNTLMESPKFSGFFSGSGKPVTKISDAQRAYAESIFSNNILQESNSCNAKEKQDENITKDQLADSESFFRNNPRNSSKFGGFCSATGKPAKEISEMQLAKARAQFEVTKLFNDEKLNGNLNTPAFNETSSNPSNAISDLPKTRNIKDSESSTRPLMLNTPIKTPIRSQTKQLQTSSISNSKKSFTTPYQMRIGNFTPLQSNRKIHKNSLQLNTPPSSGLRKNLYPILQNRVHHTPTPTPINTNKSHIEIYYHVIILLILKLAASGSRVRLREIVTQHPLSYSESTLLKLGIKSEIIHMTSENAITYRFQISENNESTWGFKEAKDELIQCGADPELIDETWVKNHYGWILWKIASMIRSFPEIFQGWWCPTKVIEHLRYRYEKEINCAHRSALKLTIEKDGSPSWPMILCVSDIYEVVSSTISSQLPPETITNSVVKNGLVLTDSWYKIRASIDPPLQRAINSKKLRIGCKIEICGAKLKGGEDAKPALEVDDSTHLILSANSTRLAMWDAKLGYSNKKPRMSLRSLAPDGGFIPVLDVIILRKYPMLFRETFKDNKPAIIRSEAEEELEIRKYEEKIDKEIPYLISEYQKSNTVNKTHTTINLKSIEENLSTAEIYELLQEEVEPSRIWNTLSARQSQSLQDFILSKEQEKSEEMRKWILEKLEEKDFHRNVVHFFKVSICDYPIFSKSDERLATLTIWKPDDAMFNRIQEGRRYLIYNVTTPNSQRYPLYLETHIRLNSMGHSTAFKEVALDPKKLEVSRYKPRSITPCSELWKAQNYDEFDLVVCILGAWEPKLSVQADGKEVQVQAIMVTDASEQLTLIEINIFSRAIIFKPKTIIFLKNLSYRKCEYQFGIHFLSTTNETQIKISPHENYAKFAIKDLYTWVQKNMRIFENLRSTAEDIGGPVLDAIYYR